MPCDTSVAQSGDGGADTTVEAASRQGCIVSNCWASGAWRATLTDRSRKSRSASRSATATPLLAYPSRRLQDNSVRAKGHSAQTTQVYAKKPLQMAKVVCQRKSGCFNINDLVEHERQSYVSPHRWLCLIKSRPVRFVQPVAEPVTRVGLQTHVVQARLGTFA